MTKEPLCRWFFFFFFFVNRWWVTEPQNLWLWRSHSSNRVCDLHMVAMVSKQLFIISQNNDSDEQVSCLRPRCCRWENNKHTNKRTWTRRRCLRRCLLQLSVTGGRSYWFNFHSYRVQWSRESSSVNAAPTVDTQTLQEVCSAPTSWNKLCLDVKLQRQEPVFIKRLFLQLVRCEMKCKFCRLSSQIVFLSVSLSFYFIYKYFHQNITIGHLLVSLPLFSLPQIFL